MISRDISFTGAHDTVLHGMVWTPEAAPVAVLQVTHGMTEHIARYENLAQHLTAQGIVVAGLDLRGHGLNPGAPDVASLGETGWADTQQDMHLFYEYLDAQYPDIPHFMLGFSLGSFLVREYLNMFQDKVAGAIIMGTGQQPGCVMTVLKTVVKREIKKAGFNNASDLVNQLSFGTYNKKFAPNKTDMDWFCADATARAACINDPLVKAHVSTGMFYQLLDSMHRMGAAGAYAHYSALTPILLLSGQDDPVGSEGKGVYKVQKAMQKAGLQDVELCLLPGRHDVLHEEECGSADAAMVTISQWIDEYL